MTTEATRLTAADLFCLPDDGRRYELLDGVLVEMAPPGGEHGSVSFEVAFALGAHVKAGALGQVLINDVGIVLGRDPDRVRGPDVCFIAANRIPAGGIPKTYVEVVPDLIVEVISPTDTATEVQDKIMEWLRAGARLVWAVYPNTRQVVAYRSPSDVRIYSGSDLIDAEPVLPGFSCPVAAFFA